MADAAPKRAVISTPTYMAQGGLAGAFGILVTSRYAAAFPETSAQEIAALTAIVMWLVTVATKFIRDLIYKKLNLPVTTTLVLLLFLVSCAGMTPRQQFYMGEVAFSAAQSGALAYLRTPYGQSADDEVLTAISEASDEGTLTLKRMRPLVPNPGQDIDDRTTKLLDAGFDTLDSIVERLNRTAFAPSMYGE